MLRQLNNAKRKILWLDTETTGLDPNRNDIWQLAALVEIDGVIVEEVDLKLAPISSAFIDAEALKMSKHSIDDLMNLPSAQVGMGKFKQVLGKYVNKFDKDDKFVVGGYCVNFDLDFLRSTFAKCGDKYFGSWFFNAFIDVRSFVALLPTYGMRFDNFKLVTLCADLGIQLKAHDALEDIKATRTLMGCVKGLLNGG
jgi:DNA polymerase-3 subunit epsilon